MNRLAARVLALSLASVSSVALLAGCGSGDSHEDKSASSSVQAQTIATDVPEVHREDGDPESITMLGVTAPVVPVMVSNGVLLPPKDVHQVGWFSDSALPGASGKGSVVFASHINDAKQGDGTGTVWWRLKKGDKITIKTSGGTHEYVVDDATVVAKQSSSEFQKVADRTMNKSDGPEFLVLITCGGKFLGGDIGYEDNRVVTARPV